jgi:hypothetical protein
MSFLLFLTSYVFGPTTILCTCFQTPWIYVLPWYWDINFLSVMTCKNKTFTSNFNKGMIDTTCPYPRDTVVPIVSDEPGVQVSAAIFRTVRICTIINYAHKWVTKLYNYSSIVLLCLIIWNKFFPDLLVVPKGSDDGVSQLVLLDSWLFPLSVILTKQRFRNWICFCPQVKSVGSTYSVTEISPF